MCLRAVAERFLARGEKIQIVRWLVELLLREVVHDPIDPVIEVPRVSNLGFQEFSTKAVLNHQTGWGTLTVSRVSPGPLCT